MMLMTRLEVEARSVKERALASDSTIEFRELFARYQRLQAYVDVCLAERGKR